MARIHESSEMNENEHGTRSPPPRARRRQEEIDPIQALAQIDPQEVLGQAASFARANPHAALAGAAVLGFVLGGGLTPRLVGTLGMIAARRYMKTAVGGGLLSMLK